MTYSEQRLTIAAQIVAGFAANPAIFASNDRCGWCLVNVTDRDLVWYAIKLAEDVLHANYTIAERQYPSQSIRGVCKNG